MQGKSDFLVNLISFFLKSWLCPIVQTKRCANKLKIDKGEFLIHQ